MNPAVVSSPYPISFQCVLLRRALNHLAEHHLLSSDPSKLLPRSMRWPDRNSWVLNAVRGGRRPALDSVGSSEREAMVAQSHRLPTLPHPHGAAECRAVIDDCTFTPELRVHDLQYVGVHWVQPLTSSKNTRVSLVEGKHFQWVVIFF